MKKLLFILSSLVMISCCEPSPEEEVEDTQLTLVNKTSDSVLVYLTLSGYPANDSVHVKNVNGIFGIKDQGLVGSFYLQAKDSLSYISPKWFSGNVSFGSQPLNCFSEAWPTGVNPFEFNLNNNQESIDISSIAGINCLLDVVLIGGPDWQASPTYPNVRFFYNDSLMVNTGLIGVYPYGCTNCTDTAGKQACQTPAEEPDSIPICTPTRAAAEHGGRVVVKFLGYTNTYICK